LALSLEQDRLSCVELQRCEFYSMRPFLLPENGDESGRARDQFEFADR
jgi:hypothetical protein